MRNLKKFAFLLSLVLIFSMFYSTGLAVSETVNIQPSVGYDYYTIPANAVFSPNAASGLLSNDTDPNGDVLTALPHNVNSSSPYFGLLVINPDGSFSYTPVKDFEGDDYFYYNVTDGNFTQSGYVELKVLGTAALSIEKEVDKSQAMPGESVTFTITVTNTGNVSLTHVFATDEFLNKTWDINDLIDGYLSPGQSKTITVNYTIPSDAEIGSVISNNAAVSGFKVYEYTRMESDRKKKTNFSGQPDASATASVSVTVVSSGDETIETPEVSTPSTTPAPTPAPILYNLTTAKTGEGTIAPGPGVQTYNSGTIVIPYAVPAEGWKFDGWTGDAVVDGRITIDGNKSITAVFSKIEAATPTPAPTSAAVVVTPEPVAEAVVETEAVAETPETDVSAELDEEAVPLDLPKTGGLPAIMLSGIGVILAGTGVLLKRRK